jgi:hypothetical protein
MTARNHYAGGRHGWSAKFACARPDPDLVTSISLHNNSTMIPPMVSVSADANKIDVSDAIATVGLPVGIKLNHRHPDAPPEGEITLTHFGNDNSDEVPAPGMR